MFLYDVPGPSEGLKYISLDDTGIIFLYIGLGIILAGILLATYFIVKKKKKK